jgi:hypothetical protein
LVLASNTVNRFWNELQHQIQIQFIRLQGESRSPSQLVLS